jgi:hypothetical protein
MFLGMSKKSHKELLGYGRRMYDKSDDKRTLLKTRNPLGHSINFIEKNQFNKSVGHIYFNVSSKSTRVAQNGQDGDKIQT